MSPDANTPEGNGSNSHLFVPYTDEPDITLPGLNFTAENGDLGTELPRRPEDTSRLSAEMEEEYGIPQVVTSLPAWLEEPSTSPCWRWVPLSVRRAGCAAVEWLRGPDPPKPLLLTPIFPHIQRKPVDWLNKFCPKRKHKLLLLLTVYAAWSLSWSLTLHFSVSCNEIKGFGKPQPISCTSNHWSSNSHCGLNGANCRPFSSSTFVFRCPAFCSGVKQIDAYVVGNKTVAYQHRVIGGPPPGGSRDEAVYRADSFICQAATHAGVINDRNGGCGIVRLTGGNNYFHSSKHNGYTSIEFPSTFPKSYSFLPDPPDIQKACHRDLRWTLFTITATTIFLISIFTTSPAVFWFTTYSLLMVHVGVVSDPPAELTNMREILSLSSSRLLPASFISYVLYLYCAHPLLKPLEKPANFQLSKTLLFLPPAFIGALNNYTFATWIPIQRLTPHDIKTQPGAPIALAIVITIIVSIVLSQAWYIRQGGKFFHFLKIYGTLSAAVVVLLVLPGFRLRIHHYILALLLMPGTAFPTRPSIMYQGLLLGLFVNGVARWGFASIIETPGMLGELPRAGHNGWWGATSPNITESSISISLPDAGDYPVIDTSSMGEESSGNGNITISLWDHKVMDSLAVDGVSVLVNDVERFRGYRDEDPWGEFTWHRHGSKGLQGIEQRSTTPQNKVDDEEVVRTEEYGRDEAESDTEYPVDLFFRFAYLRGSTVGLYGKTSLWNADGTWSNGHHLEKARTTTIPATNARGYHPIRLSRRH